MSPQLADTPARPDEVQQVRQPIQWLVLLQLILVLPGILLAFVWVPLAIAADLHEVSVVAVVGAAGGVFLLSALTCRVRVRAPPSRRSVRLVMLSCCVLAALWVLVRLSMTHLCWYPSGVVLIVAVANLPSMLLGVAGSRAERRADRLLPLVLVGLGALSLPHYTEVARIEREASWREDPNLLVPHVAESPGDWNLSDLSDYLGPPKLLDDGAWWWSASGAVGRGGLFPIFTREILIVEADAQGRVLSATHVDPFELAEAVEASPGSWTVASLSRLLGTRRENMLGEGWYMGPGFPIDDCFLNVEVDETGRILTAHLDCWD